MVLAWIITLPSTMVMAFLAFKLTSLPGAAAWIATGALVLVAGALIIWAMRRAVTAEDVEAEIPSEDLLDAPVSLHPHLEGHGPAA